MVLHHVMYANILIADIRRVLKTNGILFIKEHDAYSEKIQWLIYLEHLFYDVMDYGTSYDKFKNTYFQKLFTKDEFLNTMTAFGFEIVTIKDQIHKFNPTQSYYAILKKKGIQ